MEILELGQKRNLFHIGLNKEQHVVNGELNTELLVIFVFYVQLNSFSPGIIGVLRGEMSDISSFLSLNVIKIKYCYTLSMKLRIYIHSSLTQYISRKMISCLKSPLIDTSLCKKS